MGKALQFELHLLTAEATLLNDEPLSLCTEICQIARQRLLQRGISGLSPIHKNGSNQSLHTKHPFLRHDALYCL